MPQIVQHQPHGPHVRAPIPIHASLASLSLGPAAGQPVVDPQQQPQAVYMLPTRHQTPPSRAPLVGVGGGFAAVTTTSTTSHHHDSAAVHIDNEHLVERLEQISTGLGISNHGAGGGSSNSGSSGAGAASGATNDEGNGDDPERYVH